ncbi:MAG: hypothetical protein K1V95_01105 [Eubacterium sp.]
MKVIRFFRDYVRACFGRAENKTYTIKRIKQFRIFTALLFFTVIAVFISVTAVKIFGSVSSENKFREAAGKVCSDIISEHGTCRMEYTDDTTDEKNGGSWSLSGLSYIKQVDFNADGRDELLVVYGSEGSYNLEVWGFKGKGFANLYKDRANRLEGNKNFGEWITLYQNGGKCHIGKIKENSADEMELLALKGSTFSAVSACGFNLEEQSYSVNGKQNASSFETVRFSGLTSPRAEYLQNQVNNTLSGFIGEKYVNSNVPETEEQRKAAAFCSIIEFEKQKYGEPCVSLAKNNCFADGTAVVRLVDFNGDGEDELFVIGRNKKHFEDTDATPRYVMEVFSWHNGEARKIFENDLLTNYFNGSSGDLFYILQKKNGRVNICSNTYSYGENPEKTWRAVSRIHEMTSENGFETVFTAILNNRNGYKNYRINGKSVYKREFEQDGCAVPYFCNEDDYDKEEFEITLLNTEQSGKKQIESVISLTEETVKTLYNTCASGNTET